MKFNLIILGTLVLWLGGCEFMFTNPIEEEPTDTDSEGSSDVDTDADTDVDTEYQTIYPDDGEFHAPLFMQEDPASPGEVAFAYEGVDILLVVDNSGSMAEEQGLFSTALFDLVNALNNPLPNWPYPAVPTVRVGVVTTDLGLVYGMYEGIPEDVQVSRCEGFGDGAELQVNDIYPIELQDMSISCNGVDGSGCPAGWSCVDDNSSGIGMCAAPGGDTIVPCSAPAWENWSGSSTAAPNATMPLEVACAASVGIGGCGIEQQLKASVRAVQVNPQLWLREDALLAVFLLTDEEDCSIASDELFDTPEFSNTSLKKLNVACDLHPEHLTPVGAIRDALIDFKGDEHAVIFGALTGMPVVDNCEGGGHLIETCLDHSDMQFVEVEDSTTGQIVAQPACERYVDTTQITTAAPARRIVSLVQEFQEYGYAYSVCNEDYSGVTRDFAKQILRAMQTYEPL